MNAVSNAASATARGRRLLRRAIAALILLLLVAAGWAAWKKLSAPGPREQYQIVTVQRGDLEDLVTATGTVQPRDYVDVGAQVSGQLKKIYVEVGSQVKEGDLLAEIDPTVFLATVDSRRASLRNLQATMVDREAQLKLADLQYTRQKNMLAENATTADAFQSAEATLRSARAQIEALKAQIDQTESNLRADEATLGYARIYAPMTGTVVSITARQGQTLNASQQAPTILRIADMNTMTVQTQVSEADVPKLRPGMDSYFTTLGSQGRRWYGTLRKLEPTPTVTNNVVLYNALFDVPNSNNALLPNMTAQVFFAAAQARNVLMVPAAAVTGNRGSRGRGQRPEGSTAAPAPDARESAVPGAPRQSADVAKSRTNEKSRKPAAATASDIAPATDEDAVRAARRTQWATMTHEEREAIRARRKAEGTEGPSDDATRPTGEAGQRPLKANGADASIPNLTETEQRKEARKASAPSARASGPVDRGLAPWGSSTTQRAPRQGKVRVIDVDGKIEEREVTLGISNRVHIEIVAGLSEGEEVIAGEKLLPNERQSARTSGQQGPGIPPGMGRSPGGR